MEVTDQTSPPHLEGQEKSKNTEQLAQNRSTEASNGVGGALKG